LDDKELRLVHSDHEWKSAVRENGICLFHKKCCHVEDEIIPFVMVDCGVIYQTAKSSLIAKPKAPKKVDINFYFPLFVRVVLKSKCRFVSKKGSPQPVLETEDNSILSTFAIFVNVDSADTMSNSIAVFLVLVLLQARMAGLVISSKAKMYEVPIKTQYFVNPKEIDNTETLISRINSAKRCWIDKNNQELGTYAELCISFAYVTSELKQQQQKEEQSRDADNLIEEVRKLKEYHYYELEFRTRADFPNYKVDTDDYKSFSYGSNVLLDKIVTPPSSLYDPSDDGDSEITWSQNPGRFVDTENASEKTTLIGTTKEMKFLQNWLIALNSTPSSCFYKGLTDRHRDSWRNYLMNKNPFTKEDFNNQCDHTLFESIESLERKGCLMPFDDQRYNLSWGGLNPAKGMFPHGVGKHEFFKHESHKDYEGDNKNRDSGSSLGKLGKTMEIFSEKCWCLFCQQ
jgi:hypothetical protein